MFSESSSLKTKKQKTISGYFSSKAVIKSSLSSPAGEVEDKETRWTHLNENNLNISHAIILSKKACSDILAKLETEIEYFTGSLAQVKIFGKTHPIPRQQSAYGDQGLTYRYSGTTVPAMQWTTTLARLRDLLKEKTGVRYNFVLVNRYKDGEDKMGDHKDDEKANIFACEYSCTP